MFLLVPAHPGFPGQIPQSRKTVVCVCVCVPEVLISTHSQSLTFTTNYCSGPGTVMSQVHACVRACVHACVLGNF